MLNNEQRAHDLSVAMLPNRIKKTSSETEIVSEYLKLYNEYLRLLSLSDEEREKLMHEEIDSYVPVYN